MLDVFSGEMGLLQLPVWRGPFGHGALHWPLLHGSRAAEKAAADVSQLVLVDCSSIECIKLTMSFHSHLEH